MKTPFFALAILLCVALLTGCLSSDEDSGDDFSVSDSSGGGDCGYTDLLSSSDRATANSCGIQVSSQTAAADNYLQQAIRLCQAGENTEADTVYSNYEKQVRVAKSEIGHCEEDSGGGLTPDSPTTTEFHVLCGGSYNTSSGTTYYKAVCRGPTTSTSCPSDPDVGFSYISQFPELNTCLNQRDAWLNNMTGN